MMKRVVILAAVTVSCGAGLVAGQTIMLDRAVEGFSIQEVRFDESVGSKRPTPVIPKGWRFVGVSNGEKINSNNLWFQDQSGTVYLVRGFNTEQKFVLQDAVHKLNGVR